MKCYHMTSIERLKSISNLGLLPRNENNSKLVKDDKVKVFFSEGFGGAIALFVDFNIVYNNLKSGKERIDDTNIISKINLSENIEDYLGDGVYLVFDMGNIENQRNFENGCTDETISPNKLKVLILKKNDKVISYSRFEIIKYMMGKINPKDINYYGKKYPNSPDFDVATKKIQEKVINYYKHNKNEIEKYKDKEYCLFEMDLNEFNKKYL